MGVRDRLRQVNSSVRMRRKHSDLRRRKQVFHRCFYLMALTSVVLLVTIVYTNESAFASGTNGEISDGRELVWGDSVNESKITEVISDRRETAWCLYGDVSQDRVTVRSVRWIGFYGESDSVEYGKHDCGSRVVDGLIGSVHTHPGRFEPVLSMRDVHTLGESDWHLVSGVAVSNSDEVEVEFFDDGHLRNGFGRVSLPVQ